MRRNRVASVIVLILAVATSAVIPTPASGASRQPLGSTHNINAGYDSWADPSLSAGQTTWIRQFGSDRLEEVWDVAAHSSGIYVAGTTWGALPGQTSLGFSDAFLRKYGIDGSEVWTRQFGTPNDDFAYGVSVHPTGIYVTGSTLGEMPGQTSRGASDAFVTRYDFDGNEVWTRQFGGSGYDHALAVSEHSTGIYVSGGLGTEGNMDIFVTRFDFAGAQVWLHQLGGSAYEDSRGVSVDDTGVYLSGFTEGALPGHEHIGGFDSVVAKYDHSGNLLWAHQFGTSSDDMANDVSATSGGVYVVGAGLWGQALPGQTNLGGQDAFLRKYDVDGMEVWTRQFGTWSDDWARGVFADPTGVYVAGGTFGLFPGEVRSGRVPDAFVRVYDSDGNVVWTRQFGILDSDDATAVSVIFPHIYVAGLTAPITWYGDVFLARFDLLSLVLSTVDVSPDSVNLISKSRWLTVYIELPKGFDLARIDLSSIRLNGTIPIASKAPATVGDHDNDGLPDLMVKFNMSDVKALFSRPETYTLQVTGTVMGESGNANFKGCDTIRMLMPGDVNGDNRVDIIDVSMVAFAFGSTPGAERWLAPADFNNNAIIDITDLSIVAFHYGTTS